MNVFNPFGNHLEVLHSSIVIRTGLFHWQQRCVPGWLVGDQNAQVSEAPNAGCDALFGLHGHWVLSALLHQLLAVLV